MGSDGKPLPYAKTDPFVARPSSTSFRAAVEVRRADGTAKSHASAVSVIAGPPPAEAAVLSVTSKARDDVLQYTHAFVQSYTHSRYPTPIADSLSVAAYELFGNGIAYCSVAGDVLLQVTEAPNGVAVRVTNTTVQLRIDMIHAHLERLKKDAEGTFQEEMRRSFVGSQMPPMLGLARVVHEAKLSLEVYLEEGLVTRVTVAARSRYSADPAREQSAAK